MSGTATVLAHMKPGRTWGVTAEEGINSVTREYIIDRTATGMGGVAWTHEDEGKFYETEAGVPAVGDAHPDYDWLYVSSKIVKEGTGADKNIVTIQVTYSPIKSEDQSGASTTEACEQWGWRSGSVSRDLVTDVDTGNPVLNSAGDPFDQTVQVDHPSPVFTKVLKTTARKSGWIGFVDTINDDEVTIGEFACAAHTLKCVQCDEERIIGDEHWKYRYTIGLQYLSNQVKVEGAQNKTEIGWDVAIVDQGLNTGTPGSGSRQRVTEADESGNQVPASLPVLLDGAGARATGSPPTPYNLKFRAYAETEFPSLFYSEPS